VSAKSEVYDLNLVQKPSKFRVKITATDDPSDSEESVTDNPVEFITKFLSTGPSSDDLLKKMSFVADPRFIAALVRRIALMTEVGDRGDARRALRRCIVAASGPGMERILTAVVRAVAGVGDDIQEIKKVTDDMKKKGWKVQQSEDEDGQAVMKVDVSGIYEAEVRASDTVWDYSFQVHGVDESKASGTTDDPIGTFQKWYRSDEVKEFKQQLKDKAQDEPANDGQTVKPGGGKSGKKEEKKPTGPPSGGTEKTIMAPTALPPSGGTRNIPKSNKHSDSDKPKE
jgi:hypothetical protein